MGIKFIGLGLPAKKLQKYVNNYQTADSFSRKLSDRLSSVSEYSVYYEAELIYEMRFKVVKKSHRSRTAIMRKVEEASWANPTLIGSQEFVRLSNHLVTTLQHLMKRGQDWFSRVKTTSAFRSAASLWPISNTQPSFAENYVD